MDTQTHKMHALSHIHSDRDEQQLLKMAKSVDDLPISSSLVFNAFTILNYTDLSDLIISCSYNKYSLNQIDNIVL